MLRLKSLFSKRKNSDSSITIDYVANNKHNLEVFEEIPFDIWKLIFGLVSYQEKSWINILRTCKSFYEIAKPIFEKRFSVSKVHH